MLVARLTALTSTPRGGESNKNVLVTTDGVLEIAVRQHLDTARGSLLRLGLDASLVRDEGLETVDVSATLVVDRSLALAIEPLQSREALDAEALAEFSVRVRIDFGDHDLLFGEFVVGSELIVDGCEGLAVAAPRGEELDQGGLAGLKDNVVEVGGQEIDDSGSCVGAEDGEGTGEQMA